MYKDVKKKLLSVALCICMIIGMVQVVPKVKAAERSSWIDGYDRGSKCSFLVEYTIPSELTYSGNIIRPTLSKVWKRDWNASDTDQGTEISSASSYFILEVDDSAGGVADFINAGDKKIYLKSTGTEYVVDASNQRCEIGTYTIGKASLKATKPCKFTSAASVIITSGKDAVPQISENGAFLYTDDDIEIPLGTGDYKVSVVTQAGKDQETYVSVTDAMRKNFDVASQRVFDNQNVMTVSYNAGYDMMNNALYQVGFVSEDGKLTSELLYEGNETEQIRVGIFDKTGSSLLGELSSTQFNIQLEGSFLPGKHNVTVTPKASDGVGTVTLSDSSKEYFAGTFQKELNIRGYDTTNLKVYARDPKTKQPVLIHGTPGSGESLTELVLDYDANGAKLDITEIVGPDGPIDEGDYNVIPSFNNNGTGLAKFRIEFKSGSKYDVEKPLEISCKIASELKIKAHFEGYGWYGEQDKIQLFYTGRSMLPDLLEITPVTGASINKEFYAVSYEYLNGTTPVGISEAEAQTSPEMKKPGKKYVVITGQGYLKGQNARLEYTIDSINLADHKDDGWFTVEFKDGKTTFPYTGSVQEPVIGFTCDSGHGAPEDVLDEFDVEYANNIDAGTATVTLRAPKAGVAKEDSGFIGTMTKSFTIEALLLSSAKCVGGESDDGRYRYTGNPIQPKLKIGAYTLTEGTDYSVEYRDASGKPLTDPPKDPSTYRIFVSAVPGNKNIVGNKLLTYTIIARDIGKDPEFSFTLNGVPIEWKGAPTEPEVSCNGLKLVKGTDYDVIYSGNELPTPSAVATVIGKAPTLTGSAILRFEITKRSINNPNVKVVTGKPVSVSSGADIAYKVSLTVRDDGQNPKVIKDQLEESIDYNITKITYVTENGCEFESTSASALDALPYAGKYEVEISGTGNYKDKRIVEITCGTDISDATIQVKKPADFTYNGEKQAPDMLITIKNGTTSRTLDKDEYSLIFTRNDGDHTSYEAVDAGTVIVQAQGNPSKGYYGITEKTTSYTIKQRNLADVYKIVFVGAKNGPKGDKYYDFTNGRIEPGISVSRSAIVKGTYDEFFYDFTVKYGNSAQDNCTDSGEHDVLVTADEGSNFTGTLGDTFIITSADANQIVASFDEDEKNQFTYAEGKDPTLILSLGHGGPRLRPNVDYTVRVMHVSTGGATWNNLRRYTVTGIKPGNFASLSLTEELEIPQTTMVPASDMYTPERGKISFRTDKKVTVTSGSPIDKNTDFGLVYTTLDGESRFLENGKDYEVSSVVGGDLPGLNTTIDLKAINGFYGGWAGKIKVYTDIKDAQFLKDDTGTTHVNLLYEEATVSSNDLLQAINDGTLSQKVSFANMWPGESDGRINPDCYTVSLSCGNTPKIGRVSVTVTGNEANFYTGSKIFNINVTGSLDGNISRVEIGQNRNNVVRWPGEELEPKTIPVEVWNKENKRLTGGVVDPDADLTGYDYTVTFRKIDQVGIATAVITGVNDYSGTYEQEFKITYPINELKIRIEDENGNLRDYSDGNDISYLYKIYQEGTSINQPRIELLYPTGTDTFASVESRYYKIDYSGYQKAGAATATIRQPDDDDDMNILTGNNRTLNYSLRRVSVASDVAIKVNPSMTYTGLAPQKAEDIGLEIKYGSYTLQQGTDYSLVFSNAVNTNEVDGNKPATVTITGQGNFVDTKKETFNILPLPLTDEASIEVSVDPVMYTGEEVTPKFTIRQKVGNTRNLELGKDYEIVGYADNSNGQNLQNRKFVEVGTYYVGVKGLRNYSQTLFIEYQILERQMTDGVEITFVDSGECIVVNGVPNCVYNRQEHTPGVYVSYEDKALRGPGDTEPQYELKYEDNKNAGTATVTVTGIGSFAGERKLTFEIRPKNLEADDIAYWDEKGNIFADEQEFKWMGDGKPIRPEIEVTDKTLQTTLTRGEKEAVDTDYYIDFYDENEDDERTPNTQVNAGEVTMTIVGQNNYIGSKKFTYFIGEDISKSYVLVDGRRALSTTYNGLTQPPQEEDITVVWNSEMSDTDENGEKRYRIAYYYYAQGSTGRFDSSHKVNRDQIVDAGTYYVAVVGEPTKGTYAKSDVNNSCAYTVQPRNIGPSYILVSGYDGAYYYTGHAIEPKGLTVEDTDLPVSSGANDLQKRSVKLTNGIDYTVGYANNISAGKASIIVTGKGNYTGTRTAYFNILSSSTDGNNTWNGSSEGTGSISNGTTTIAASDIILGFDNSTYDCMMYNGYERTPTISINGINANEFTVTASNNVRPGVATLMITGRGNNYTGTILKNYKIMADLSKYGTIAAIEDQVYTGYQITPQVTLTCGGNLLNQGSDYTVTYMNNTNVGRATVTATASSDSYYVGSATGSFNISNTAGGMEITGYASSYTYTGYAITPDVVVTMNGRLLNRGTDYVVSYSNNTNVGTATMTVNGIGSFSGTKTINYTIEAKNIENCITTAVTNYKYTGNTYTPSVTITDSSTGKTLVAGTDYTIVYSNNTNPGTASITVTALSKNYTGTKVIPFKITSAAVSGLRTSAIKNSSLKLSWTSQDYADGYQICNSKNRVIATTRKNSYTVKGLSSCTTYKYKVRSFVENADGSRSYGSFSTAVSAKTRLNTPKLKAVSTKKGKVTLTWTKISKATGYEIYYSTKKNGIYTRLKTISKSSTRKYVDSGLASGEKYYYTIRAYRTTNGVKTYSSYNTIKAARVK